MKYSGTAVHPDEVQDKLKNNEVLLEYVFNEGSIPELYSFCISKNSVQFHRIDIDSSFISSLENTYRFMASPDYLFTTNARSRQFCAEAHKLYSQLLSPFADVIRNKKIIIVPDGKLNYLPFDGLLTAMPDTSGIVQFNRLPYLIFDNAVHYTYSAKLMFGFSHQRKRAKNRLLAFAPECKFDTVSIDNETFILAPLPGIQREVELISKIVKGQTFSGDRATEINFRQTCEGHDILHLAMHAFINDSLPAFSRLAFSQNEETSPEDDGWLNTSDIYNLRLNARLAVLSACNTGSGGLKRGEGVMSLARGFLYAGCPALVMTLWDVEDDAATKIMHSFYKNLKKGRSTDKSLRSAKLSYLENANARMAHPHYWLGYLSIGNNHPLFASYDLYFFLILILALSGITADQFIRTRKDKKKR